MDTGVIWEHALRDQEDHDRHVDDIHDNPLKHGLEEDMRDWPWSSFHGYVKMGYYPDEK